VLGFFILVRAVVATHKIGRKKVPHFVIELSRKCGNLLKVDHSANIQRTRSPALISSPTFGEKNA
jgi:hypothetical protein